MAGPLPMGGLPPAASGRDGKSASATGYGTVMEHPPCAVLSSRPVAPETTRRRGAALIFDMDGVIVHSTPLHNESWQLYLRRHGIQVARSSIETKMLGKHNGEIVRIFFGEHTSPEEVRRHGAEKEKLYREMMRPRLAEFLVPGIAAFLDRHRGLPLGLASNAEAANVDFVLDASGLRPYFGVVVDGHQVSRPKPFPDIYLRTTAALGVDPADCIVFEDSATGIQAAREAGARVVGLTTTSPHLDGCDLVIADFLAPELESWLQRFQPVC